MSGEKNSEADTGKPMLASDFVAWLNKYDLTDSNAARVLGVSSATVKLWCIAGVTGAASQFIAFLMKQDIQPHYVASELRIVLSPFLRSQYHRRHGGKASPTPMPGESKPPRRYRFEKDKI